MLEDIRGKRSASQCASAAFVCALFACVLAFILAPSLAWAEPEAGSTDGNTEISTAANMVTVTASISSQNATTTPLRATVSYDKDFKKGDLVRFTFNVTGTSNTLQYRLFSFQIKSNGGWTSVIDSSRAQEGNYTTKNYFEERIATAGTYLLRFQATDDLANPVRFDAIIEIPETGTMKSVDTVLNEVAAQCKRECAAKGDTSQYAYALWLNDWLIENMEYDSSGRYCSAEAAINQGLGTCEGYHRAYVMLLNKVGIQTRRVDSRGDDHVWTGAFLDGQWYNTDVTWNDPGYKSGLEIDLQRLYFALPNDIMKLAHTKWDGDYAVTDTIREPFEAKAYADNYFIRSGEIAKYTKHYTEDTSGSYSVKAQLAKKATSFKLPVVYENWPDNYKNIIYNLVAYQLEQEKWDGGARLKVSYADGELSFQASYPTSIEGAQVEGLPTFVTFNGKAFEPRPTKVTLGGKTLTYGTDYQLSHSNNKNVSTASNPAVVTITGMGDYAGTIKKTFTINQLDLSKVTIDAISYPVSKITYTGSAIEPRPKIRTGDGELDPNAVQFVYTNNLNVGNATITIRPKDGNCINSKSSSFEITRKPITNSSVSVSAPDVTYDGNAKRPVVVKDGSRTLKEGTDYTISYSNNVNLGTAKATITGIKNYNGSRTVQFTIKEAAASTTNSSGGSAATPPAATSPSGNNSSVTPSKPVAVTTQPKPQAQSVSGTWKKSGGKWWFAYDAKTQTAQNKQYPVNEWVTIAGKSYHFDGAGYMHKNWQKLNNKWYYFASDGAMRTGWQKSGGKWYYLHTDGIMRTGKIALGDGKTYYLNTSSGAMKTGWNKEGSGWYYYAGSGAMAKGWTKVGKKWYYLNPSNGLMQTGFYKVGSTWYYSNGSGAMLTGWQKVGGKYYYFNGSGAMQYSKWIGNYYVGSNGVMATNTWIGKYHVNASGKWDRTK